MKVCGRMGKNESYKIISAIAAVNLKVTFPSLSPFKIKYLDLRKLKMKD